MLGRPGLTLGLGGLTDDLLQRPHLGVHLLVVDFAGLNFGRGEEGRVGAHVGALEVALRAQRHHQPLQLPGRTQEQEEKEEEEEGWREG